MKKFEIIAIAQDRIVTILLGLILLLSGSIFILIKTSLMSLLSLAFVLAFVVLAFVLLKRYFTYSLVLTLSENGFEVAKKGTIEKVSLNEVEHYKIEHMEGVRLVIKLTSGRKLTFIASKNFGSDPLPLQDFCKHFEQFVKTFESDSARVPKRKGSFLETKFAFYLVVVLAFTGFGGILLALVTGRGFSVTMLVIAVPILYLISALINTRRKK